ncbi:winged helix-turn-helix domain-containing protein [Lentilitoribacter sp. Alg239-R112]|uniref:ArsR/SmtB family transcription factor n=1 Tax=Lentilitoribacter sp. Alg239-R112 TaxID=2305987 RepID=UPI0013A69FAC|nr:winged helix-turn-helix domain-containing protein [Lentilitoribacter sp. Alg239-R112]
MKEGPDIALLGSLIGDPARANILTALMSGKALTASELASEAGVTVQTTSSHLKKLQDAKLLKQRKQGRHRYFELANEDVGGVLEAMMGLAAKQGLLRTRTGPKDQALRKARICYNHLAGDLGVRLYDSMIANGQLKELDDDVQLTSTGEQFMVDNGIDIAAITLTRRPLCKSCLDWSSRRTHLAGALGTAFLHHFFQIGWASRKDNSRIIKFTQKGEKQFLKMFPL